ncbi:MAG: ATPase domain-containing protein [Patescibacteria group bacterium]
MKDFNSYFKETGEIGYVQSVISSIFYVNGLPNARINELVVTENGMVGIVKAVMPELVEVMIFEGRDIIHDMKVVRTNEYFQVPVSDSFLGRIIDPFGVSQDHLGLIDEKLFEFREVDPAAPGITQRVRVKRALSTGVMSVDMLFPLGHGQRQLILGDPKTGKTTFALQSMVNQAKAGSVCIYVSIGKKKSDTKFAEEYLRAMNVFDKSIIVAASSSDPAPMVYLAPYAALSIAEHFRDQGRDVLVVLDDMTSHAKYYREISLLARRPPGRQSYPGDIFHVHARLVERAGNIRLADGKEASITLLPIAETMEGDLSGYIQTNLMAMTDGHIFFDVTELKKGRHPSVSFTLSVSRVGNQTKSVVERELNFAISTGITQARKAEELGRFGVELTPQTMQYIRNSAKIDVIFNQEASVIFPKYFQILILGLFIVGFWSEGEGRSIEEEIYKLLSLYEAGKLNKFVLSLQSIENLGQLQALLKENETYFNTLMNRKVIVNTIGNMPSKTGVQAPPVVPAKSVKVERPQAS